MKLDPKILSDDNQVKYARALLDKSDLWFCPACKTVHLKTELVTVRQCGSNNCKKIFEQIIDNDKTCPDCKRPYTRKLTEMGCYKCLDGYLEEIEF